MYYLESTVRMQNNPTADFAVCRYPTYVFVSSGVSRLLQVSWSTGLKKFIDCDVQVAAQW